MDIPLGLLLDWAARWLFACTLLSLALPPVEFFDNFPRFQEGYRLFCKVLKYWGSLDFRGKVIELYPCIQKKNGDSK